VRSNALRFIFARLKFLLSIIFNGAYVSSFVMWYDEMWYRCDVYWKPTPGALNQYSCRCLDKTDCCRKIVMTRSDQLCR
jgi:hypothetical protein